MVYIENILENFIISCKFTNLRYLPRKMNTAPKGQSLQDSGKDFATGKSNLQMFHDLRLVYPKKLLRGQLDKYNPRNKNIFSLDYFVISETKRDDSFPNGKLTISNNELKQGGIGRGIIKFVMKERSCMYNTLKI